MHKFPYNSPHQLPVLQSSESLLIKLTLLFTIPNDALMSPKLIRISLIYRQFCVCLSMCVCFWGVFTHRLAAAPRAD